MIKEIVDFDDLSTNALVSTKVAANYLVCSQQAIRNWVNDGELQAAEITLGGNYKFLFLDLKRFKDKRKQAAKEKRR